MSHGDVSDGRTDRGLESYLDHDDWFRREVQKGIDQADRGELLEHEEVVSRVERQLREKPRP